MSLQIIKAGILDTIQDKGRYGHQHQGINPGGAMDRFSAALANALLGKDLNAPVIEFHFPAAQILFRQQTIICLAGADFSATINDESIALRQPVAVPANSALKFIRQKSGARCYLSTLHNFQLERWLGSYSTNLKAEAGGYRGRRLLKDDEITFEEIKIPAISKQHSLPWMAGELKQHENEIEFITGNEWKWLTNNSQKDFLNNSFKISSSSDRMGYRLSGEELKLKSEQQLVSSAVSFGTVQLLPNGQLIILMADHQTTGGYPRIAHVISAHLPRLAQMHPNEEIKFVMTDIETAEYKFLQQQNYLPQLQNASKLKIKAHLNLPGGKT